MNDKLQRQCAANHMRWYREHNINGTERPKRLSREQCADRLGVNFQLIKRIESQDESNHRTDSYHCMEEKTGIIAEWWQGKTECKSRADYEDELAESARNKRDFDQLKSLEARKREKYVNFFSLCGFSYKNDIPLSPSGIDFSGVVPCHELIDTKNQTIHDVLTDKELNKLMDDIHSLVAFSLYKRGQQD